MGNGSEHSSGPLLTWAKGNPLPVATLLGGVIYVLVFESYRAVLRYFGVTPADVGIDYTDVIWPVVQNIGFLVFVLAGIAASVARFRKLRVWLLQEYQALILFSVIPITLVLSFLALSEMAQYRADVEAGSTYDPLFSSRLQVLAGLRANRVTVVWVNEKDSKPTISMDPLLFLGSADGVTVLYSHCSGETIRVPTNAIMLTEMRMQPKSPSEVVCKP